MNLLLVLMLANPLRIAVLGDRSGHPDQDEFILACESIRLMCPDIILSVGDYVEGNGDVETAVEDWGVVKPVLEELESVAPLVYTPGNNDIWNDETADYWREYTGTEPSHITEAGGIRFVVWDSSIGEVLLEDDILEISELISAEQNGTPWMFVTHKPFWFMTGQNEEVLGEFYSLMEEHGPLAVVGGHIHLFASERRNGILYVSAGPSGSGTALNDTDPYTGNLTQLGWMTAWPDSVAYTVIDSRGVYSESINTGEEMLLSRLYETELIHCRPLEAEYESMNLTLVPQENISREVTLMVDPGNWGLRPDSITVLLEDTMELNFTQNPRGSIYPSPVFTVLTRYGNRNRELVFEHTPHVMRRMNAFRGNPVVDGVISEDEYRSELQYGFADFQGNPSPLEGTGFTAGNDGDNLFIALRTGNPRADGEDYCGIILAGADGSYIWLKVFDDGEVEADHISSQWDITELDRGFYTEMGEDAVEISVALAMLEEDDGQVPVHIYRSAEEEFGTWVYPIAIDADTMGRIWLER